MRKEGFTIVELVIIAAMIGILIGVAVNFDTDKRVHSRDVVTIDGKTYRRIK